MFRGETHIEKIRLRGKDIAATVGEIKHQDLRFYPENPRIYSIVHIDGAVADQKEIYEKLRRMEHVKQLVQSIKSNDGLHDPIIVKGRTVLEGNSRLAAYRMLSENDPVKWGFIKAKVLPDDTSESMVFALLGEYHLIGKKDWAPYEQAGYLYRRNQLVIDNLDDKLKPGLYYWKLESERNIFFIGKFFLHKPEN